MPTDASSLGWQTDRLLLVGVAGIGAIALAAIAWLLWSLFRPRAAAPRARRGTLAALGLVGAVVALDVVLFVGSELTLGDARAAYARDAAVRIEVLAQQWSWQARYPGADGDFATGDDAIVTNEVVVPVGRTIEVQLRAADVVHAFYAPAFRVRQDVVPGRTATVRFRAAAAGTYELACSQFCGVSHHRMAGTIRVVAPDAFAAWERAHSADGARITAEHARAAGDVPDPRAWGWAWAR